MPERVLMRGFEVHEPVDEKYNRFLRLHPVVSVESSLFTVKQTVLPDTVLSVYGWTEHALRVMDELGISFPPGLHGPVLLPSADEVSRSTVRVWFSSEYAAGDGNDIWKSVVQIVDAWMTGTYEGELSADDKNFLATHYPPSRSDKPAKYNRAVTLRLQNARSA